MKVKLKSTVSLLVGVFFALNANANQFVDKTTADISLKTPGSPASVYSLKFEPDGNVDGSYKLKSVGNNLPVNISQQVSSSQGGVRFSVTITALENVYFNYSQKYQSNFKHDDCQFYMPGFWYRRNLRSPQNAPSFHTSESWTVREDRLSAPLTGIYDEKTNEYVTISRIDDFKYEALTTHNNGEVIVSGKTSIGYTGFENVGGKAALSFGFPYHETPKTYIRKLTLIDPVEAFQYLEKGKSLTLTWELAENKGADFSSFIEQVWKYAYDLYAPQVVETPNTPAVMKEVISNYFKESFVDTYDLKYMSGVHLHIDDCEKKGLAEVGFVGRVLLNAFNALEYGEQTNSTELVNISRSTFDSYLKNGFTKTGFFKEVVDFEKGRVDEVLSIRRQSEGVFAMLYYLQYEKNNGRKHPEWDAKIKNILKQILKLQKEDGSFPRKFKDDLSIVDSSKGSTPSATPMLVLASRYFKDKTYLEGAKKTAIFLEKEIISKADYFSSTLDANCEDKEASYYATTALYHLAMFTKGKEKEHYSELAKKSAFFCLTWYYLWDVPFAQGQMLGDAGLKTRGWGNVSVENNHIDVYIFDFATILDWLSVKYNEPRFSNFSKVIKTSMCQLLPKEDNTYNIAKKGYYPEVVQHTNWDYGKNGKGFYNDIFAPGWTVASLWEMLSPDRINLFAK